MVRRIVACRSCRKSFTTMTGSKLCLSCRPDPPVSTSEIITEDGDVQEGAGCTINDIIIDEKPRQKATDVISIGSSSDDDGEEEEAASENRRHRTGRSSSSSAMSSSCSSEIIPPASGKENASCGGGSIVDIDISGAFQGLSVGNGPPQIMSESDNAQYSSSGANNDDGVSEVSEVYVTGRGSSSASSFLLSPADHSVVYDEDVIYSPMRATTSDDDRKKSIDGCSLADSVLSGASAVEMAQQCAGCAGGAGDYNCSTLPSNHNVSTEIQSTQSDDDDDGTVLLLTPKEESGLAQSAVVELQHSDVDDDGSSSVKPRNHTSTQIQFHHNEYDDNGSISSSTGSIICWDKDGSDDSSSLLTPRQYEEANTTSAIDAANYHSFHDGGNNAIQPSNGDDGSSSVSSDDSIWNVRGLASKQREGGGTTANPPRIESYYDYYRLRNQSEKTRKEQQQQQQRGGEDNGGNKVNDEEEEDSACQVNNEEATNSHDASALPPEVPPPTNATWRIVILMDHREYGCANNFLQKVEKRINDHFGGGGYADITTLDSADYLYVARLIHNATGEILDERVLDLVIERKSVTDACNCLISNSKKYKPLSFFEAQMYKLQHSGMGKKLFLMEGDDDKARGLFSGAKSHKEKERRLKRVKTLRLQLANGEFDGVDLICTRSRWDTVKFLIHQLEEFRKSFNPRRPPAKTRVELKNHINEQMKASTFMEYLRLRSIPGIGDAKAMKVIMDPNLDWDKNFVSPSSTKKTKATLEDRATFWKPPSTGKAANPSVTAKQTVVPSVPKDKKFNSAKLETWLKGPGIQADDRKENKPNSRQSIIG